MTEQQPTSLQEIGNDDDVLVALWWRRSEKQHSVTGDPDAARALDWVSTAIRDRMMFDDTEGTVWLLDRLLDVPGADMEVAADNVVAELLQARGPELAPMIAGLAERYPRWRAALQAVDLDQEHRTAIPELTPYLMRTR